MKSRVTGFELAEKVPRHLQVILCFNNNINGLCNNYFHIRQTFLWFPLTPTKVASLPFDASLIMHSAQFRACMGTMGLRVVSQPQLPGTSHAPYLLLSLHLMIALNGLQNRFWVPAEQNFLSGNSFNKNFRHLMV